MEDKVKAIIEAYKSGLSQDKVAKLYGVTQLKVSVILRKNKVPTRHAWKTSVNRHEKAAACVEPIVKDSIIEAYRAGSSVRQIGSLCGLDHGAVAGYLRAWGVPMRPSYRMLKGKGKISEAEKKTVIELYQGGLSLEKVGKKIGRSARSVARYLRSFGVAIATPGWKTKDHVGNQETRLMQEIKKLKKELNDLKHSMQSRQNDI